MQVSVVRSASERVLANRADGFAKLGQGSE